MCNHQSERRIIAIVNQKGGVGKTTTTINLGTALAAAGKRILIVDLDPQGNASTGMGVSTRNRTKSSADILLEQAPIVQCVQPTGIANLDIIPASPDLSSVDFELAAYDDRLIRLKAGLKGGNSAQYQYVLFDCPPSLNFLTLNALVAATHVLVPLQCEFFALEGLSQLLRTIGEVKRSKNPSLDLQGIVLTMYDARNNLSRQVEADARQNLGDLIYNTKIPRNVRLSEAPSHAMPALLYDHRSAGSIAYQKLAGELLHRMENIEKQVEVV